jgi:AcrR family transcriptional regulator
MKRQRDKDATHGALLEAGAKLIAERGFAHVTLANIAEAAGVSRQSVYLHFGSRAGFLTEVADYIWQQVGLPNPFEMIESAPTAHAALRKVIELRALSGELLDPYLYVPDSQADPEGEVMLAYNQRQRARLEVFRAIAKRMKQEGVLRDGITVDVAADLMWSVLSVPVWRSLVSLRGWSRQKFVRHMERFLMKALAQ